LEDFCLEEEVDINIRESSEMKIIALLMYCEVASEVGISQYCCQLDNESQLPGLHEFEGLSIRVGVVGTPANTILIFRPICITRQDDSSEW
jgi:hypothetical protein